MKHQHSTAKHLYVLPILTKAFYHYYTGAKHPPKFVIRQQFSQHAVDIGLLTQLSGLIDAGKPPKSVLYDKAREFNLISGELSNDEIDGLIEQPSMTYEAFNQFRKVQGSSGK